MHRVSSQGHPELSDAFVKHARKRLNCTAAATYEQLAGDAHTFDPLDARQLAKHFLAAKRAVIDSSQPGTVILLCIWWEPQDAAEHPVFRGHRAAVDAFAAVVSDTDVAVKGISYRELWDHWDTLNAPLIARHTQLLRDRYDVPLR